MHSHIDATPEQREIALRIALAARALPDTDAKRMIAVLSECLELPFTLEQLNALTPKTLKTAAYGELKEIPGEMLRTAILYLKGEDSPSEPLPVAQPDHPYTDAAELLRVACASNQGEQIDGHFGSCARFLIYDVCPDGFALAEIRTPNEAIREGELEIDRTLRRAQLLQDCDLLFVLSIGGPPAARVTRLGVHPVKIKETSPCSSLLEEVQDTLKKSSLPRWIRAKRLQAEALSA